MTNDNNADDHTRKAKQLAFVLSQLRDDLEEIVAGLETKALPYGTAKVAATTAIEWVHGQLKADLPDGG